MTKGQRRAGTQTLHISSSPISQCTFQDLLGRGEGEGGEGAGVQEEKEDREREKERESAIHSQSFAQRNCFSPSRGRVEKRKTSDKEVIR